MRNCYLFIIVLFWPISVFCQFHGGTEDGHSSLISLIKMNDQSVYTFGGNEDGSFRKVSGLTIAATRSITGGSSGDGYCKISSPAKITPQQNMAYGGGGDGFSRDLLLCQINISQQYVYGGSGDGTDQIAGRLVINPQTTSFNGGSGDGTDQERKGIDINHHTDYVYGGSGDGADQTRSKIDVNQYANSFKGGIGDGADLISERRTFNIHETYISGGSGDGVSGIKGFHLMDNQVIYSNGGIGDGHSRKNSIMGRTPGFYASGGTGDGFSKTQRMIIRNDQLSALGGYGDGFSRSNNLIQMNKQSFIYGGVGDGFAAGKNLFLFGPGVWKGVVSSDWNNASNWNGMIIPDHTLAALIPPGCPNYPDLPGDLSINDSSGLYRCSMLEIRRGGSVTTSGTLRVHGEMIVKGDYFANNSSNRSQLINSGGTISLTDTGKIWMGNQTYQQGFCDLVINDGGKLDISSGDLSIDDNLLLMPGGTFLMSAGNVFIHRSGEGSSFSQLEPGNLFVDHSAYGNISGGIIRICGKPASIPYHSVNIKSPDFILTGTSTLEFVHGNSPVHQDADVYIAPGSRLQNLNINKPGNSVTLTNDAFINGKIKIFPNTVLLIDPSATVTVMDSLIIMND